MALSDAVNDLYVQSLAAKRYVEKNSVRLLLNGVDEARLVTEIDLLTANLAAVLANIKSLTNRLNALTLGELRKLADQLGITTHYASKDDLIAELIRLRRNK